MYLVNVITEISFKFLCKCNFVKKNLFEMWFSTWTEGCRSAHSFDILNNLNCSLTFFCFETQLQARTMDIRADMKSVLILFLCLLVMPQFQGQKISYRGTGRGLVHSLHRLDKRSLGKIDVSGETEWFEQRLDHFNAQNTKTWRQRYFSR